MATGDGRTVVAVNTFCHLFAGLLLEIDPADGREIARHAYDHSTSTGGRVETAAATSDGGFVLAGWVAPLSGNPPAMGRSDALVIKADAQGNELWRRTYGGADDEYAWGVAATADGGVVVAGFSQSFGGAIANRDAAWQWQDVLLVRLDAVGQATWQKVKGNSPPTSDVGGAIARTPAGAFLLGGSSDGTIMLAAFDRTGATVNLGATDLSYTIPATVGVIQLGNAVDVAAASVRALTGPRQVGGTSLDLLAAAATGAPVSAFCNGGGSYAFSPGPSPQPPAGGSYRLTFTDCVTGPAGDAARVGGGVTVAIDTFSGSLATGTYDVQATISEIDLALADVGTTLTSAMSGGMRYARTAASGALAEVSSSISAPAPQAMTFTEGSGATARAAVVGPFTVHSSVQPDGALSLGAAGDPLAVSTDTAALAIQVAQPVRSPAGADPASGGFGVTAPDGSTLTASVTDGTLRLEVDTDGDGIADGTTSVAWGDID
jgi:hypothetical protein